LQIAESDYVELLRKFVYVTMQLKWSCDEKF